MGDAAIGVATLAVTFIALCFDFDDLALKTFLLFGVTRPITGTISGENTLKMLNSYCIYTRL